MADRRRRADAAERERQLVTPEGVALTLGLARGGQRLWAFLLDLAIMMALLAALTLVALFVAGLVLAVVDSEAKLGSLQITGVIWLLGFFVLRNCWFILFESGRRTATPGKRLMKIRVAARDGSRLTVDAVVARNLMRELEFFLPLSFLGYQASEGAAGAWVALAGLGWSLVFAMFPLFNRDRLRAGDLIAGTWVLKNPQRRLGQDIGERAAVVDQTGFRFSDAQLDAYGVFELQTLEDVLRRGQPNPMRRATDDPIVLVAGAIRTKIGYRGGDDYAFLAAYYAAVRVRLERGLLMGRRRRDKADV